LSVRVLVVDGRPSARAGLLLLVCAEDDLAAVGEAGSVEEAIAEARALRPDVIVLDAALCKQGEGDIVQALAQEHPSGKVVVLSVQDEPQDVREAFELGASGYVLKQAVETELVSAIREVAAGGRYVSPDLGARLIVAETAERRGADGDSLSDREREVLRLLALGHTNQEIAQKLHISVRTSEAHRAHIMQKLRLSTRAELVRYALDKGMLET
jgi:two-component system, NarL family, response regulator NreC